MTTALEFQVRRDDFAQTRWVPAGTTAEQPLEPGDVLLRVDRFALTANNITYAVVGDLMRYWDFFPAPEGWGRIPVWGFADVAASRAGGIREGDRVFGYLPIAPYLRVCADRVSEHAFVDASEHRRGLADVYQQYVRTPRADPAQEAARAVLSPLFGTGFLIDDFLQDQKSFGARQLVFASASSKTALATAFMASRRPERDYQVIALTSARNRSFCERVGYYDRVLGYDEIAQLPAATPAVLVDMAANKGVLRGVHEHLGAALRYSCLVGMTHQPPNLALPPDLPGPAPQLFFAPTHIERHRKDWGMPEFNRRVGEAQAAFLESARGWLQFVQRQGRDEIEAAYRSVLAGQADPGVGIVLSFGAM